MQFHEEHVAFQKIPPISPRASDLPAALKVFSVPSVAERARRAPTRIENAKPVRSPGSQTSSSSHARRALRSLPAGEHNSPSRSHTPGSQATRPYVHNRPLLPTEGRLNSEKDFSPHGDSRQRTSFNWQGASTGKIFLLLKRVDN